MVSEQTDGNSCPEIITRNWSYTDNAGNMVSHAQTITVDGILDIPDHPILVEYMRPIAFSVQVE